jgi:hypothetical protein
VIEAEFPWVLHPDSEAAHQRGAATPQYANQLAGPGIAAICDTIDHAKTELNLQDQPNDWGLSPLIEIARKLDDITESTAGQARLAKDFRNLIHPGRENRKKMRCDRGTAHAAFAALNLAIVDLERRWRPASTRS